MAPEPTVTVEGDAAVLVGVGAVVAAAAVGAARRVAGVNGAASFLRAVPPVEGCPLAWLLLIRCGRGKYTCKYKTV